VDVRYLVQSDTPVVGESIREQREGEGLPRERRIRCEHAQALRRAGQLGYLGCERFQPVLERDAPFRTVEILRECGDGAPMELEAPPGVSAGGEQELRSTDSRAAFVRVERDRLSRQEAEDRPLLVGLGVLIGADQVVRAYGRRLIRAFQRVGVPADWKPETNRPLASIKMNAG
jgi:hypothetical protein